jgi:hypothetical protein
MADLHPLLIDKRVVERNIAKGLVDRKQYDKYLADLPDQADNGEVVALEPSSAQASEADASSE